MLREPRGIFPRNVAELRSRFHSPGMRNGAKPIEVSEMSPLQATPSRIKHLIVNSLHLDGMKPEMIADDAPLFGEGLGLDSVDALELVVALEKEFGIKIKSQELGREVFSSVASLSQFIESRNPGFAPG
jgi:acyl carrier protein